MTANVVPRGIARLERFFEGGPRLINANVSSMLFKFSVSTWTWDLQLKDVLRHSLLMYAMLSSTAWRP